MHVRERIRRFIDARSDLSYTSVAEGAGLSNSALQKFLSGKTKSMTLDNIESVAKAMGAPLRWVIFGDDPEAPEQWTPRAETLNRLLAAALTALPEVHVSSGAIQAIAHGVAIGLQRIAADPAKEGDLGILALADQDAHAAARRYGSAPEVA